jgi:hypothetical protein
LLAQFGMPFYSPTLELHVGLLSFFEPNQDATRLKEELLEFNGVSVESFL